MSAKNVIEKRQVDVGTRGRRWVVKEGLKSGEWVVFGPNRLTDLRPGMTIQPRRVVDLEETETPPIPRP